MYFSSTITAALLQLATLCSASPLLKSARTSTSGPACSYIDTTGAIPCAPGECCGWALTDPDLPQMCDASTASGSVGLSNVPAGWTASCAALAQQAAADSTNYILTAYAQDVWHAIAANDACRFEVSIADPNDSADPIHISTTDVTTLVGSALAATGGGSTGATGSTKCYSYQLQWRVVPPGN